MVWVNVRVGRRHLVTALASPAHHRMRHTASVPQALASVRVLGPVQLLGTGGDTVDLPSAAQRRLLGVLAIHASTPVRAEYLCGVLGVTGGALPCGGTLSDTRKAGQGRLQRRSVTAWLPWR